MLAEGGALLAESQVQGPGAEEPADVQAHDIRLPFPSVRFHVVDRGCHATSSPTSFALPIPCDESDRASSCRPALRALFFRSSCAITLCTASSRNESQRSVVAVACQTRASNNG